MSVRCPDGHLSETEDWCDECGSRILATPGSGAAAAAGNHGTYSAGDPGGPAGSVGPAGRAGTAGAGSAAGFPPGGGTARGAGAPVCPACSAVRIGNDRYCEVCGYDFVTGTGPRLAAAVPIEAEPLRPPATTRPFAPRTSPHVVPPRAAWVPPTTPPPVPAPAAQVPPVRPAATVQSPSGWIAEVVADREFFDRGAEDGVRFPATVAARMVELGGVRSLIGRQSRARGYFPDIDLSVAPEDRGVSRTHAILDHPSDGSLTITDLGSSNGTWVDDDDRPLARNVPTALREGARIYVGSWTRITVRRTR